MSYIDARGMSEREKFVSACGLVNFYAMSLPCGGAYGLVVFIVRPRWHIWVGLPLATPIDLPRLTLVELDDRLTNTLT